MGSSNRRLGLMNFATFIEPRFDVGDSFLIGYVSVPGRYIKVLAETKATPTTRVKVTTVRHTVARN